MPDTRQFAITLKTRRDGIQCYFFTIDGETRFSSYDAKAIKNFAMGYCGRDLTIEDMGALPLDPREPDYTRQGIFQNHNCWRCNDGAMPCVQGKPNQCEHPHARND